MKSMKILGCIGILAMAVSMTACSSSNDNVTDNGTNTGNGTGTTSYVWTTDGGLKACDHILFSKGKEDANGIEIGNGDQEFVFTGKQTLKRHPMCLMDGYILAMGAQLTIEPGTIIKGDKDSKAALIVERGGKLIAKGTSRCTDNIYLRTS